MSFPRISRRRCRGGAKGPRSEGRYESAVVGNDIRFKVRIGCPIMFRSRFIHYTLMPPVALYNKHDPIRVYPLVIVVTAEPRANASWVS
jgi:hypothetical protein